jgi:hypothetical protein
MWTLNSCSSVPWNTVWPVPIMPAFTSSSGISAVSAGRTAQAHIVKATAAEIPQIERSTRGAERLFMRGILRSVIKAK